MRRRTNKATPHCQRHHSCNGPGDSNDRPPGPSPSAANLGWQAVNWEPEGILNYPRFFALLALVVLWLAAQFGAFFHRWRPLKDEEREDFGIVQTATLTLLGLII